MMAARPSSGAQHEHARQMTGADTDADNDRDCDSEADGSDADNAKETTNHDASEVMAAAAE